MKRLVAVAVAMALACGITAVLADTDPIAERRALMKHDGDAAKTLFDMSKGKIPFDLATVKDSLKTLDEGVGEVVIALELRVPPDPRLLAVELRDTSLQRPMEGCDPTFVPLDQLDVVEVRVADEGVPFEVHRDLRPG